VRAYNFAISGSNLRNFIRRRGTRQRDNVGTTFERVPQQNLGGQKRPKFGAIYDNCRLWAQMTPE